MKKPYITIFLLFFIFSYAQKSNDFAIYVDSLHNKCKESNYKYIRVVKDYYLEKDNYDFAEYYKSGKIAIKGTTKDKNYLRLIGTTIYYYENGNRKQVTTKSNSQPNEKQFRWYENEKPEFEKELIFDPKNNIIIEKIIQHWDENNIQDIINGNGFYKITETKDLYLNPKAAFSESGEIKNGFRHGIWTGKSERLKIHFTETYNEGQFINGISTDLNNSEHPYTEIFKKPVPKTGMENFYKYIGQNYTIPRINPSYERPLNVNLEGKVIVSFIIAENGKLIDPKILYNDLGYGTGNEALRIIKKTEDWIPAEIRGIVTKFSYSLPIVIRN